MKLNQKERNKTMKKTYSNPTLKVVQIQTQHLMAGSETMSIKGTANNTDLLLDKSSDGTDAAGIWDDEE